MSRTSYEQARAALAKAVVALGFPVELADALEPTLGSENAMRRMAAYLHGARPSSIEEVVDEALAIVQMRDSWVQHKISEHANAKITQFYNRPRDPEDDADDNEDADGTAGNDGIVGD